MLEHHWKKAGLHLSPETFRVLTLELSEILDSTVIVSEFTALGMLDRRGAIAALEAKYPWMDNICVAETLQQAITFGQEPPGAA